MTKLNIGIIGAGLSGLFAAYELQKQLNNNVTISVFEKERYLGGRVYSKLFSHCSLELGAQFFIHEGEIYALLKEFKMESEIISLQKKFISFYYKNNIIPFEDLTVIDIFKSTQGKHEKQLLFVYLQKIKFTPDLIIPDFDEWYRNHIGTILLPFWNRMLQSIGVRDSKSINAYFGLTLMNVFFGHNYLLKTGLTSLIEKIANNIIDSGGKIHTGAPCQKIQKHAKAFSILYQKNKDTKEEFLCQNIISTVPPEEAATLFDESELIRLKDIDYHPMKLYVISSNRLWQGTWGLIIYDEKSPIYAVCDWRNVMDVSENTPILVICSPRASAEDVTEELKRLFPMHKKDYAVLFEKKWKVGLHQCNQNLYKIPREIRGSLPHGFYLAGDWTILPALEGAVLSGRKAAHLLIKNL